MLAVTTLHLKLAMDQPGCPICRLRRESEARYIFFFLYENINDLETRLHLIASQGLCPAHTWQAFQREVSGFGDGLGNSIVYVDLCQRIRTELERYRPRTNGHTPSHLPHWRDRLMRWLASQRIGLDRPDSLTPHEPCRVCEIGEQAVESNLGWLIEACADDDPAFRQLYAASSGLCLPHLRQAVMIAKSHDQCGFDFILMTDARRLTDLVHDLSEYGRKHAWDHRDEVLTDAERASVERAVSFFGGLPPNPIGVPR
jgi:hypothetical protein